MIANIHASLFPEVTTATRGKTLQGLYEMLSSSRKYHNHSDRIICFIVVELLSLRIKDREQRILKEHAALQSEDVLHSKEMKFLELINFLSYEPKERLIGANILPGSAKYSSEDAAELISGLIRTGCLAPTSASIENLLKIADTSYKMKIKEVVGAPMWTDIRSVMSSDLTEPDSPRFPFKSLGAVSQWSLTSDSGVSTQYASGEILILLTLALFVYTYLGGLGQSNDIHLDGIHEEPQICDNDADSADESAVS